VMSLRPLRPLSAVMTLLLALASPAQAQDHDATKTETRQERKEREKAEQQAAEDAKKAEKQAAEDAKKAEKQAAEEAKKGGQQAGKKAAQDVEDAAADESDGGKKKGKQKKKTKEDKQRELVESGAKTAIEWYAIALERYKSGHYIDSRALLLPLEDSPRAVDIQEKVKLLIADTYFEQGGALNLSEALARYKTFLTFYPSSEHAAYAQYQLGRSYFKQLGPSNRDQSFTENAIIEYQRLIETFPDSEYAPLAEQDILEAKALRASHEFEVARFYWDWGDKQACATRLMTVLKERPELPERERALYLCAQSLYDVGRPEEAAAYAARLAADYPASEYSSKISHSEVAMKQQAKRDAKDQKELQRTHRAQLKLDRRRTRQIRRDSGLPGDVPLDREAMPIEPGDGKHDAASAEKAQRAAEQRAEREAEDQKKAAEREQDEQDKAARQQEKEEKARAKEDARAQEEAAKAAAETPKQKAEREKREAKAKAEADRLEADEQKAAAKKAEQEKKKEEERAREAAKKAEQEMKKAKKKADKQGS